MCNTCATNCSMKHFKENICNKLMRNAYTCIYIYDEVVNSCWSSHTTKQLHEKCFYDYLFVRHIWWNPDKSFLQHRHLFWWTHFLNVFTSSILCTFLESFMNSKETFIIKITQTIHLNKLYSLKFVFFLD